MIYRRPAPGDAINQGDIIDGCPLVTVERFDTDKPEATGVSDAGRTRYNTGVTLVLEAGTMSITLEEALAQVDLQPGQTYHCKVNGHRVAVQVLDELPADMLPAPLVESDIMLEAWTELPLATEGGILLRSKLGEPDWPDSPIILPEDGE